MNKKLMHYVKYTDRTDIYIEENRNIILIQEKWDYKWLTAVTPLKYNEKKEILNHFNAVNL